MIVYACKVAPPVASPSVDQSKCTSVVSPATSTGTAWVARIAPVPASRINTVQAVAALPELVKTTVTPKTSPDWTAPSASNESGSTAYVLAAAFCKARISRSKASLAAPASAKCTSAASQLRPTARLLGDRAKET